MSKKKRKGKLEAVFERIEYLRSLTGSNQITPDLLVQDAKENPNIWSKAVPKHFWDDKRCAQEHRLDIMRGVLRIRVEVEVRQTTYMIPRYVHNPENTQTQGYISVVEVADQKSIAKAVLAEEFKRVLASLDRAMSVAKGLKLESQLKKLIQQINDLYTSNCN